MFVTAVTLGFWQDRDPLEAVATARLADALGYGELWVGEMATFDAFALATAVGAGSSLSLTLGPLAVAVRDPVMIAMGAASVAALTGRPVSVAIGTSSPVVVERWHGRDSRGGAARLRRAAASLRPLLAAERDAGGYRLRLPAPHGALTVAAFGPAAVRVAADHADRMVVNLCTVDGAARLARDVRAAAGERPLRVAAWVPAAVDPDDGALEQLRRGLVPYVAAPGYGEMFAEAGFGDVVDLARSGAPPAEVLTAVPVELVEAVGAVGGTHRCRSRLESYAAAGVDEVVIVPVTAGDPAGERTLRALAPA